MELLKQLYKVHSPSRGEKKMRSFIKRWVRQNVPDAKIQSDKAGNLYITRGEGPTFPCVVAHIDQVQRLHPKDTEIYEIANGEILMGFSRKKLESVGLGADDKNGVWIALKALHTYNIIKVALFTGEEIGCWGSAQADMDFFKDCRFVIQPDRKGGHDLITEIGGTDLCSKEFLEAIGYKDFGYVPTYGMMTDVEELKNRGLGVSCINLSCGYYHPHSDHEITVIPELINCKNFVFHIINTLTDVYPHIPSEYQDRDLWGDEMDEEVEYARTEITYMLEESPLLETEEIVDIVSERALLSKPILEMIVEEVRAEMEYENDNTFWGDDKHNIF